MYRMPIEPDGSPDLRPPEEGLIAAMDRISLALRMVVVLVVLADVLLLVLAVRAVA